MEMFLGVMLFVMGSCFGSFINMLEYRTALAYKLKSKKFKVKNDKYSYCDGCGKRLNWYENIPVFSFLMQSGKTRCCHKKLSPLYPFIEFGMGILFVSWFLIINQIYQNNSFTGIYWLDLVVGLILLVFLWFSTIFDFKYMILPDFSTLGMGICALILSRDHLMESLIAGFLCFIFILILHKIKIRGEEAMGGGDVKYALVMGILLGGAKTILSLYIAFIIGAIVGVILMMFKKINKKAAIAFGPFLILGTIVSWWFGKDIIDFILKCL